MKKSITSFFKSTFAGMIVIAVSAATQAAPISYTYTYEFNEGQQLKTVFGLGILPHKYQLQYDLHSGSWSGDSYNPATDFLGNLDITLNFSAPDLVSKVFGWWEGLSFTTSFYGASPIQTSTTSATVSLTGVDLTGYDLSESGLDILLTLTSPGSVLLTGYTLTFNGERTELLSSIPVSAPSSLALLSVGLLGAGFFGRRRTRHHAS